MLSNLLLASLFAAGSLAPATGHNVLVILLDDVGRDKLACYGDHPSPAPTPNLDALRAQGVLFRNAWACQSCSPTRASLLTGRYSDRTGIGRVISLVDAVQTPLAMSETILPEALPGYRSIAIGKWHLNDSADGPTHSLDSGFDQYYGYVAPIQYTNWTSNLNGNLSPQAGYSPVALGGFTIRALQGVSDPFFVYYCPQLAHAPFHSPPDSLHSASPPPTTPVAQHKAMVESIDTIVGRVLAHVDLSTTYVFVIGDNGSPRSTVTAPFRSDQVKGTMYEGGLRVPLIVAGPGVAPGLECAELVGVTDLFATIRELTGSTQEVSGAEDSVSFAPLLQDPQRRGERQWLYAHLFPFLGLPGRDESAIRTRRWKLIESNNTGIVEVYDLLNDPFELNDLVTTQPGPATDEIVARLRAMRPTFP